MSTSLRQTPILKYYFGLSFLAIFLVGVLSIYPPLTVEGLAWRKPLIGSIYILICLLGISAIFFPNQCSQALSLSTRGTGKRSTVKGAGLHGTSPNTKGHHPDCDNFSSHVFELGNRTFCTACAGLLAGALASIVGTALYFFDGLNVERGGLLLVWLGLLGVGAGLVQYKARKAVIRFSLNMSFVLGTFLVLIGIDKVAQNVFADMFLVLLALFWLYTRILISQWDHKRICSTCNVGDCEFRDSLRD
jgi:hypothetical protein